LEKVGKCPLQVQPDCVSLLFYDVIIVR
jgi:hypothetical protein